MNYGFISFKGYPKAELINEIYIDNIPSLNIIISINFSHETAVSFFGLEIPEDKIDSGYTLSFHITHENPNIAKLFVVRTLLEGKDVFNPMSKDFEITNLIINFKLI